MNTACQSGSIEILSNRRLRPQHRLSVTDPSATLSGQSAEWLSTIRRRLQALSQLEEGWDGQKAKPVSHSNIDIALQVLLGVMQTGTPVPTLVPTVRGGLQIEWHLQDVDIELEIESPAPYVLSFEDRVAHREFERELTSDLHLFAEAVTRISARR